MTVANSGPIQTKINSARRDSVKQYGNPVNMVRNLWAYRELIRQFTWRQVLQRYRGSYLGILWSFAMPLALLLVYTFVFSVIFQARWEEADTNNPSNFALILFAGLVIFNIFSETVSNSPTLIISNPNYVKKVVFPLEVLSVSQFGAVLINSLFSIAILLIGMVVIQGYIPWTAILLPLMLLPLSLLCLGLSWFLAAIGVAIRDIRYMLEVGMRLFLFVTPIFYPLTAVPAQFRFFLYLNPLTLMVEHFRQVVLFGQLPNWGEFGLVLLVASGICLLGYIFMMKTKRILADII